mgnify:FL=1|tara:strand:- start:1049 stop:1246 length:198 start_codon:yes stop_codon:yes gene_type:complete
MMDFKLKEIVALEIEPHPNDVAKGNFSYWTDLALLMGIDLVEEAEIINDFQEEAIELNEGDSPSP